MNLSNFFLPRLQYTTVCIFYNLFQQRHKVLKQICLVFKRLLQLVLIFAVKKLERPFWFFQELFGRFQGNARNRANDAVLRSQKILLALYIQYTYRMGRNPINIPSVRKRVHQQVVLVFSGRINDEPKDQFAPSPLSQKCNIPVQMVA